MKGLHHLLRLQSLQNHQLVPKVPPLTRPTLLKQVTLPLLPLLVVNGEICSLQPKHLILPEAHVFFSLK